MTTPARKPAADPAIERAIGEILGCRACTELADTPFYRVVDSLGGDIQGSPPPIPPGTLCPRCDSPIGGETLVDWE
jgi:hypothetical protein